jgi:hypothetical protein
LTILLLPIDARAAVRLTANRALVFRGLDMRMQHTSEIMHNALALLGGFASVVACICSCIFSMLSCIVPAAFYRLAGSSSRSQQINWFGNPKTQGLGGSHGDVRKKRLDFLYAAEQRVDSCKRRPELGSTPHLAHIRAACGSIKPVVI